MADPQTLSTRPLDTVEGVAGAQHSSGARSQVSLVIFHLDQARVVRLVEGKAVVVGRDPTAEVPIADDRISRRHASFCLQGGAVVVADLGSTNGTKLNGVAIQSGKLGPADEVVLGNVTVSLHVLASAPGADRTSALSHDAFVSAIEDEVERAKTFGRGLSVVMVRCALDPAEALAALRRRLRPIDRVAAYGDGTVEALLPESGAEETQGLLNAVVAELPEARAGFATYPADGRSADALLESCRDALHRASTAGAVRAGAPSVRVPTSGLGIVSASSVMEEIFLTVKKVAPSQIPVLIRGETGVGKEVLARALHDLSPRANHRLVSINCGAIPQTLVESVLFGHERGAFTGAAASARGLFEEADGSTLLLDEVGELSASAQAALLRVLETKEVRRVGGSKDIAVDVRVVAATHRDLEQRVRQGEFREDLLYRLNATTLEVPPLRERPEEIGPFAQRFVTLANAANGRAVEGIDSEAMRLLLQHPWPGNIRELRNAIEHAVVVAQGPLLRAVDLPRRLREAVRVGSAPRPATASHGIEKNAPTAAPVTDLRDGVQRFETEQILAALRACGGNRTDAARQLQIPVRTLSHKIRQYGIKKLGFGLDE